MMLFTGQQEMRCIIAIPIKLKIQYANLCQTETPLETLSFIQGSGSYHEFSWLYVDISIIENYFGLKMEPRKQYFHPILRVMM